MPIFCGTCGTPFTGTGKFCGKCGAPIAAACECVVGPVASATPTVGAPAANTVVQPSPAQTPVYTPAPTYAAPAPSTGGGSALKIIFIILGIFLFLGLLGMGSCAYIAYRAKQKINAFSGEMKSRPYRGRKDPCALVSMTEVGGAVGQQVIGMQPVGTSACLYHFGNGSADCGRNYMGRRDHDDEPSPRCDETDQWHGRTFTRVDGLGDEAYIAPMGSALMMRKGDVMVNIDLREGGLNAEGAKQIAKKIAGRLQ